MGLTFHRFDDAASFLERAGDFLIAREAERDVDVIGFEPDA